MSNVSIISWREQVTYWDDVHFVLAKHTELDFYSASSLKQQSTVDMSLHSHIILIPIQPVFALTP